MVSEAEKRTHRYYQSCLKVKKNTQDTDTQSREALLQFLQPLIGGWQHIEGITNLSYVKGEWDFQKSFETIHNDLQVNGFFRWVVELHQTSITDPQSVRYVIQVRTWL